MADKHQVIALHAANPQWSANKIAQELGCLSGYVRATAQRNGLSLAPEQYRVWLKPRALLRWCGYAQIKFAGVADLLGVSIPMVSRYATRADTIPVDCVPTIVAHINAKLERDGMRDRVTAADLVDGEAVNG